MDEVVEALCTTLRESVPEQWRELREVEIVLEELAAEFQGEDPLPPPMRSVVDETRAELQELVEKTQRRVGPFDLPDPDKETLAKLRTIAKLPEPR
jgi:hypothetical protein